MDSSVGKSGSGGDANLAVEFVQLVPERARGPSDADRLPRSSGLVAEIGRGICSLGVTQQGGCQARGMPAGEFGAQSVGGHAQPDPAGVTAPIASVAGNCPQLAGDTYLKVDGSWAHALRCGLHAQVTVAPRQGVRVPGQFSPELRVHHH